MKGMKLALCVLGLAAVFCGCAWAQQSEVDMLLDYLVEKRIMAAEDVSVFRARLAVRHQEEAEAKAKKPASPANWVERIKWGGDV